MATRKKILVPIELEGWQRAVEVARDLAAAIDADIVLLHAIRPLVNMYPDLPATLFAQATKEVEAASRRALEEIAAETRARVIVRIGEPVSTILSAVAEESPQYVVIGTHGRRGLPRWLLGSVAENVVRQCQVPVLTVRPAAE
jgi:nucleotide-binding universal stress UspA family protein